MVQDTRIRTNNEFDEEEEDIEDEKEDYTGRPLHILTICRVGCGGQK